MRISKTGAPSERTLSRVNGIGWTVVLLARNMTTLKNSHADHVRARKLKSRKNGAESCIILRKNIGVPGIVMKGGIKEMAIDEQISWCRFDVQTALGR